ncbi:MAG: M23 family metallopeptidase [Spirochaetes bacterium]|nr:M23 family metallopeptidase [Spirochaetota bacterium]
MQRNEKYLHVGYAVLFLPVLLGLVWMAPKRLPPAHSGQGQPALLPMELEATEPAPRRLVFVSYKVAPGDTISGIAEMYNVTQDSIISWNNIEKARTLQIGTVLQIPNMNGLMHEVKAGDTLESISRKYGVDMQSIRDVNELAMDGIQPGQRLFIPEAKLPTVELRRVWGELFRYPVRGWISSPYGWRADPITGARRFHNGIDIGGFEGEAVRAALEGRVAETGYNDSAGNYILLSHVGGYTTFYAHLRSIAVTPGMYVREGQKIGEVGSTGYSTGAHLHFSVFRWGRPVNPVLLLY